MNAQVTSCPSGQFISSAGTACVTACQSNEYRDSASSRCLDPLLDLNSYLQLRTNIANNDYYHIYQYDTLNGIALDLKNLGITYGSTTDPTVDCANLVWTSLPLKCVVALVQWMVTNTNKFDIPPHPAAVEHFKEIRK